MSYSLLLVDDQDTVLRVLEYVFTHKGHRVLTANSGKAALELLRKEPVDAAVIDMHMPEMDGFQTAEALLTLARERGDRLRVWMMTGAFSTAAQKRAQEIGAVALLAKPFDYDRLCVDLARELGSRD
ncbi:MAG TPA: response regulator [Opitutus sp.]|nr:response regulator [Opitutus sp.]